MNTPNTFTIYNASAGSGKTFMLVKEYLLLLLQSPKPDAYKNILAITFTNKAVAEMKSRIVDALIAFSETSCPAEYGKMLEIITEETGISPESIKTKTQEILKSLLYNYAAFEVSTIDGFTQRILRTFSRDLELPLNFDVEINIEEVLQKGVDRVISKAGQDEALTKTLVDFVLSKADEDKSWDVSRDLFQIAKLIPSENNRPFLKLFQDKSLQDFKNSATNISRQIEALKEKNTQLATAFFDLLTENGLGKDDFYKYCINFFQQVREGKFQFDFGAVWQREIEEKPLFKKSIAPQKKDEITHLLPQIVKIFYSIKYNCGQLQLLTSVKKNLVQLSLLNVIQHEIEKIKEEESLVLISEFNSIVKQSIKEQPAPFIYERLGERYRHYFIDEFQDTSKLQWENLKPLISHALDTQHQPGEFASLGLVGDAKQSIYRWRGGEAGQFIALCAGEQAFNIEQKLEPLPNNYRSAKEIVDFNNHFFRFAAQTFQNPVFRELFEKNSEQIPIKGKGGYVNIGFIDAKNAEEEKEIYPQEVLKIIQTLEKEAIQKRDICILTRKRDEGVSIANYLSEHEIPIVSAETLLVSRSSKVNFINALLGFSINKTSNSLKLQILGFLLKEQLEVENEHDFISKRLPLNGQSFFDSLALYDLYFEIEKLPELSLYEGIEYCISNFRLIQESDAYVLTFLEFVFNYSQTENLGIANFLEHWEQNENKLSINAPEGSDAVQIMTIHKAKGLEFPVVIYPFANSTMIDTKKESLWVPLPDFLQQELPVGYVNAKKEMEIWGDEIADLYTSLCSNLQLDALNLLYVALTRPTHQLYIISKMDLNSQGQENTKRYSGLFISYLKNIGLWNEGYQYELGGPSLFSSKEKPTLAWKEPQNYYTSPKVGEQYLVASRAAVLWGSQREIAIEKGEVVHSLFSKIKKMGDEVKVLEDAIIEGLFPHKTKNEFERILEEVMCHPELKEYFSEDYQVYNERDIISEEGKLLRPDRINISGNHASVIDYKTGSPQSSHKTQVNSYTAALQKMGFTVNKGILVYLNPEVTVTIV